MGMQLEGDEQLRRALKEFPEATMRGARRGMRRAVIRVQRSARDNAPVDTGRLRQSIAYAVRTVGDSIRGIIGSAVKYAPFVEFGTRPHWPPLGALQPWARRHGFPAGASGAFLVARKIAQFGTPATRFLRNALEDNKREVERDLTREINKEIERLER